MTKIPRHYPFFDDCNTSMEFLHKRVTQYMQNSGISGELFFTDYYQEVENSWKDPSGHLNLITFGDTARKMFQSGNFIHPTLSFWNISTAFAKLQNQLLFKGKNVASAIPRYKLFPQKPSNKIDLNKKVELVFAGRISYQKNIPSLLFFHQALKELGVDSHLHLFGAFDHRFHEHLGRRKPEPIEEYLKNIIKDEAIADVSLHGRVAPEEWLQKDFNQPVFISLSTFFGEDFGVALAQAQEKGWPIIASDFGGHQDVEGEHVFKLPPTQIGHSHLPLKIQKLLSHKLAELFKNGGLFTRKNSPTKSLEASSLTLKELDQYRRELVEEVGPSSLLINLESLEDFSDTPSGGLFIRKCLDILEGFDGKRKSFSLILPGNGDGPLKAEELHYYQEALNSIQPEDQLYFISEEELSFKDNIHLLKRSHQVFYPQTLGEKTLSFLKNIFP